MGDHGQHKPKRNGAERKSPFALAGSCAVWAAVGLLAVTAFSPEIARGQTIDSRREANVKAVFLYSFGRYVTWPDRSFEATGDNFVIAIFGDTPVTAALSSIAQKRTIGGRKIVVRRVASVVEMPACQILFVARTAGPEETNSLLASARDRHVLVVGESAEFARQGGAVGFYVAGDTVRFAINVAAARKQELTFNAKILSLGKRVDASTSSITRPPRTSGSRA